MPGRLLYVDGCERNAAGAILSFEGGGRLLLPKSYPAFDIVLSHLADPLTRSGPLGVVWGADCLITEVGIAQQTYTLRMSHAESEPVATLFFASEILNYLSHAHPDFDRIYQTLRAALTPMRWIWYASHHDGHRIMDVLLRDSDPAWQTATVLQLARAIRDDRAFDRLPILGDALEEAGCTDSVVLDHCRAAGPHALNCWVVDLLLRREE
jgi:hypothetical protein